MSTFIGKILVIVIMVVSLVFLGISTVVFSTSKNWLTATSSDTKKIDELKKRLQVVQQEADTAKKSLEDAKAAVDAETKVLTGRLATLEEENKRDLEKIAATRELLVTAQKSARETLDEVQAKREQIQKIHQQQAAVDKQAGEYRRYQSELNDRVRELERILEPANKHRADLNKKPSGKLSALIH